MEETATEQVGLSSDTQSQEPQVTTNESESAETPPPFTYDKSKSLSQNMRDNPGNADQALTELEKLEKFRWKGKTITAKDLEQMAMFNQDYTAKTKALAAEKKFNDNLVYDLRAVRENPDAAEAFKRIYPKKYHGYLDVVIKEAASEAAGNPNASHAVVSHETKRTNADASSQQIQKQASINDPRLDELYENYRQTKIETAQVKVDAMFDKLVSKYSDADEGKILARVQSWIERAKGDDSVKRPDEADIEKMFKADHDAFQKKLKDRASHLLEEQRKANTKGASPLAGGAIPGQAPRVARTIKEATQFLRSDGHFS